LAPREQLAHGRWAGAVLDGAVQIGATVRRVVGIDRVNDAIELGIGRVHTVLDRRDVGLQREHFLLQTAQGRKVAGGPAALLGPRHRRKTQDRNHAQQGEDELPATAPPERQNLQPCCCEGTLERGSWAGQERSQQHRRSQQGGAAVDQAGQHLQARREKVQSADQAAGGQHQRVGDHEVVLDEVVEPLEGRARRGGGCGHSVFLVRAARWRA